MSWSIFTHSFYTLACLYFTHFGLTHYKFYLKSLKTSNRCDQFKLSVKNHKVSLQNHGDDSFFILYTSLPAAAEWNTRAHPRTGHVDFSACCKRKAIASQLEKAQRQTGKVNHILKSVIDILCRLLAASRRQFLFWKSTRRHSSKSYNRHWWPHNNNRKLVLTAYVPACTQNNLSKSFSLMLVDIHTH